MLTHHDHQPPGSQTVARQAHRVAAPGPPPSPGRSPTRRRCMACSTRSEISACRWSRCGASEPT